MAKKKIVSQADIEGLKELGRLILIAVIPVTAAELAKINQFWAVVAIVALKSMEKFFYERGKNTGEMNPVSKLLMFK